MLKNRRWLSLILLLVLLLVLTMIVLALIPGKFPGSSLLSDMLSRSEQTVSVSEFNFDVGRNRSFAYFNGAVTAVGTLGLQVLGPDGHELLSQSYRMTTPALIENNGRFLAFDIGGNAVRVFTAEEILSSIETEGSIVSASINGNGWFCIITQPEVGGSRGDIAVYNNNCSQVFEVIMGSGYVLTAELSEDNTALAILNIAETGSRVNIYNGIDIDKDYADYIYELGNEIFIDIDFLSNTHILAFGEQSVRALHLTEDYRANTLYTFDDKRLGGYTHTNGFIALHLYDYNIGYSGQIITVGVDGTLLGQSVTDYEIVSMAAYRDTLICNGGDGVVFYDITLNTQHPSDSSVFVTMAGCVLAISEDLALTANDLSAVVIRRDNQTEGSTLS